MKIDLSTKEGYDLACGLRRPDSDGKGSTYIKWIFPARLRWFAESGGTTGAIRERAKFSRLSFETFAHYMVGVGNVGTHCFCHYHAALCALRTYSGERIDSAAARREIELLTSLAGKTWQFLWGPARVTNEEAIRQSYDNLVEFVESQNG